MLSLETVVAVAIRSPVALDQLSGALTSDLVLANPFLRRLVEFADEFYMARRRMPASGDWEVFAGTLPDGMIRDGTREALGRVLALDVSGYDPSYFGASVLPDLQRAAAEVARARLNGMASVDPSTFTEMAAKLEAVKTSGIDGLARLSDLDVWLASEREDARTPTGFPTLDRLIGGWGKELGIVFADSAVGKSFWLQNASTNCAVRGKTVLHITLELGLRQQVLRYYRQIAQATRGDIVQDRDMVRGRLSQWMRLAQGEVYLIELAAHECTIGQIRRLLARLSRLLGKDIDVLVTDYLDLLALDEKKSGRSDEYSDLGKMTHGARRLCPEFDLTHLTASQAVRKPKKANRLTMSDMGDSYNKVRGTDLLLSLQQTDAEEAMFQGRLGVLKARDSGGRGTEVPLYINRDLAYMQEISHPNTVALMRQLGHLPEQLQVQPTAPAERAEP